MTYERAIKELEYEYNHLAEEYEFTETCRETQAFKMAFQALKKQIPAEPIYERIGVYAYAYCPSCKFERAWRDRNYCPRCGQKLDFSEVGGNV